MSEIGWKISWELTYIIAQFVPHVQENLQILEAMSPFCGATDTPVFQSVSLVYKRTRMWYNV